MRTLIVFAMVVVVVAAAANPWLNVADKEGEFVLTKDYSLEDGVDYSVKYVKPFTPGKPRPFFPYDLDDSDEVYYYLATHPSKKGQSWSERISKLRQMLSTGVDLSAEDFYSQYSTAALHLPPQHKYYIDSSGEIYYVPKKQNGDKTY